MINRERRLFIGKLDAKVLTHACEECNFDGEQGFTIWGATEQGVHAIDVARELDGKEVEIVIREVFRLKSTLDTKLNGAKKSICEKIQL